MNPDAPKAALIACEVFRDEIQTLGSNADHIKTTRWLEIGLHDRPNEMCPVLQQAIDELDARKDIEVILLAYGLCGLGTTGLKARSYPLVLPRAHDCITVFLGSKETYAERQQTCPGCYHYTPGWNRARRVPGPDRLEMLREEWSKQFDPEEAEFLIDNEKQMWSAYNTASFIDLGTPQSEQEAAYTQRCAESLGWKFEHLRGDPQLLHDLLWGPHDDARFQTIHPGQQLGHSTDAAIMRSQPAP
jgi:hypothetical protein